MAAHPVIYVVAVGAGVAAGFINTLAGSGSFLTLPALIWLGLPAQIANATNRVGILLASMVALRTFPSDFGLPRRELLRLFVPSTLGALLGAQIAIDLDPRRMEIAIGVLMLGMLALLLAQPNRFLVEQGTTPRAGGAANALWFFLIGIYGGFIQAGVGIFLLGALVLSVRLPLKRANVVKLALVLVFTLPAFALFVAQDQVDWPIGLLMAAGQGVGAFVAARFASRHAQADRWIHRLLIAVLSITGLKLLLT